MKRLISTAMLLGFSVAGLACGDKDNTTVTNTKTTTESKTKSPGGDKIVETKTTTETKTTEVKPADDVGVAECDDYLKKMAVCLGKSSPEANQAATAALVPKKRAWREAAATADGKVTVAADCKQAAVTAKSAYPACEF